LLILLIILELLWLEKTLPAEAQSDSVVWSGPVNLSNTPPNSDHPAIIADEYGYIHVFWSEDFGGERMQSDDPTPGNSILYTRWDGIQWSPAIDILSVPEENIAEFVAVTVDPKNYLHVVWTAQSNFYYSNAPSWQAESAHAWSKPIIVATNSARSLWESSIAADASGNLHIVYATRGDEVGVYYIGSHDRGETWSTAIELAWPLDRLEQGFANVKIIADKAGRLHAVWQTFQKDGYGQAVYYTRSGDGGQSWSKPIQLGYRDPGDFEAGWPYPVSLSESELHLIYLDGAHGGRSQRISTDGGETWSEPHHIIPEMEGVNGYVFPVIDGIGGMHLIINMRTFAGQVVGIYYARWLGNSWSSVVPVATTEDQGDAHYTAAIIRLGNELHIVWTQLHRGEIQYIRGIIPSVAQTTPLAVPSPQPPPLSPSPAATLTISRPTLTPLPESTRGRVLVNTQAPSSAFAIDPLVVGLGASLLLVGTVTLWLRLRPR
jgi:hypothetical protein